MPLLIPAKADPERDRVARAWERRFDSVIRLDRFWEVPDGLGPRDRLKLYGSDTFCLVVAQKLELSLLAPDDRLIASASKELTHREVRLASLDTALSASFPLFAKPAVPKQFQGRVYNSAKALRDETKGLAASTEILLSEVVEFHAEARAFCLDGTVCTCSVYEGEGDVSAAAKHAERVVGALDLPRACVCDVGLLANGTWALVELNSAWGAGLNGCDAESVLECIVAATTSQGT